MRRGPRRVTGSDAYATALVPAVLLADADEDARAMVRDALLEGTGPSALETVADGAALRAHLHDAPAPPALVLVDAALPPDGGIAAVRALKAAAYATPVVVLTRDDAPAAAAPFYAAGANTVLAKPVSFLGYVRLARVLTAYWLDAARLP